MSIPDTWVDEDEDREGVKFQAVCEDCSWCSVWFHADAYDHIEKDGELLETPEDQAYGEAKAQATNHECAPAKAVPAGYGEYELDRAQDAYERTHLGWS
jgi:hypothetical protein